VAKGRLLPQHHTTTKSIQMLRRFLTRHPITSFLLLQQWFKGGMHRRRFQGKVCKAKVNARPCRIRRHKTLYGPHLAAQK